MVALGLLERQGDVWLDHGKPRPGNCILAKIAGHNHGKPQDVGSARGDTAQSHISMVLGFFVCYEVQL
jgi:hypothetical protein